MLNFLTQRSLFLIGSLFSIIVLGSAFYLEYIVGLEVCPLCIIQRLFFATLSILCLIAWLHNPAQVMRKIYALLIFLLALLGTGVAARHVWLQYLMPEQPVACGAGLEQMLKMLPLTEAISQLLQGAGSCTKITWQFLWISIPGWSFLCFCCYFLLSWFQFKNR